MVAIEDFLAPVARISSVLPYVLILVAGRRPGLFWSVYDILSGRNTMVSTSTVVGARADDSTDRANNFPGC